MDRPNTNDSPNPDLIGVRVLLVEDSWQLGIALRTLLEEWGADVSGPAATCADARRLALEQAPDVALVDFNLRGGERADGLVDQLHDQGVYIIVTSGDPVLPVLRHAAAILRKPLSEARLLDSLRQAAASKAQR